MAPQGLAILLGIGPTTGSGIARHLASPTHGNLAVALLSRSISETSKTYTDLTTSCPDGTFLPVSTDTSSTSLKSAFEQIHSSPQTKDLPLKLAIFNIKHSHKTPFLEETREKFDESMQIYIGGAVSFAQLAIGMMLDNTNTNTKHDNTTSTATSSTQNEEDGVLTKKGTLIFTGTMGALRTNSGFAAYGAGKSGVRMLAQSLAREFSPQGVQVVHAIANGGIGDVVDGAKGEDAKKVARGAKMRAESVGKLYLWLMNQEVDLWVHELDMRPAAEKF